MGPRLADDIVQSVAGPCEFRTASLWGLGQRIFLLHDGRTTDLVEAIEAHASRGNVHFPPSEANAVIRRFRALGDTKKQDMLDFLRVCEARTWEDPRIGSDPKSVGISGSQAIQLGSAAPRCWPLLQHAGSACHLERDPRGWCALSCTEVVAICCLVGRFGWSARETVPDRSRVALGSARAPSVERSRRQGSGLCAASAGSGIRGLWGLAVNVALFVAVSLPPTRAQPSPETVRRYALVGW